MAEPVERLATLEAEMKTLTEKLDSIDSDLKDIKETLSKQRGFIAGVLAVLAPLWGIAVLIGHNLWNSLVGTTHS